MLQGPTAQCAVYAQASVTATGPSEPSARAAIAAVRKYRRLARFPEVVTGLSGTAVSSRLPVLAGPATAQLRCSSDSSTESQPIGDPRPTAAPSKRHLSSRKIKLKSLYRSRSNSPCRNLYFPRAMRFFNAAMGKSGGVGLNSFASFCRP